jgi:signal transduction histidine kinase
VIITKDYEIDQVYAHGLPAAFLEVFKYVELSEGNHRRQQDTAPIEPSQVFSEGTDNPIPEKCKEIFAREGIHACIQATLYSHNHIFGSFWLFYDRAHTPSPYDVRLMEILAAQASVALENIALNQANQEHAHMLEDRVAERTTELAIALDKAEDADRLKSQLLSTVSHELRTPLAVIKAHSSTIHTYYDRLPKERHLQYLSTINEEADRLSAMINSLLDMSRLEAGKLEIRPIAFQPLEVFEEVMQALRARYNDRPLITEIPSSLKEVNADPERLRQLIANLVDNAVKYSPVGTPITIGARPWDDSLEFWVKDEGNGLTPSQARRVFERFYQTDDNDYRSARNGVGLGLAICKGLVEEMGGRIWCTSEGLNKGSKFAFTLPWAESKN